MHILSPIVTPPSDVAGADSKKKPPKRPKPVGDSPSKPAGDKPAAKKPKKSKNPEPLRQSFIPKLSLPSSSGIPSTSLLSQLSSSQLSFPSASPQLSLPTASLQQSLPTATQTPLPPPDNPKKNDNTEGKKKGKTSGGNDPEKILMSLFVKPEYRLDKTADGCYRYTITHPLFNSITGHKCKTEEAARQSATNKVIKHLIQKHNFKMPDSNY